MNNNNRDSVAGPATGSAPTGDDAIMDQVNQALRSNATTARFPIDVAAIGATVTLSGTVGSQDVKRTAEQLARGVPGGVDVTNDLVIGDNSSNGVFGIFGNHDNDADSGAGSNGGANTGGLGVMPLTAGSGASSGTGIGSGVPLAMGLGGDEGSSASGETRQSRNADAEEEDLS